MKSADFPVGMSVEDLARSLGVSVSTIYHWDVLPGPVAAYFRQLERANAFAQGLTAPLEKVHVLEKCVVAGGGVDGSTGFGSAVRPDDVPVLREGPVDRSGDTGGGCPGEGAGADGPGKRRRG